MSEPISYKMPDGNYYQFDSEEEATLAYSRWEDAVPAGALTPEQIAAHQKRASISMARAESPNYYALKDFTAGASNLHRSLVRKFFPDAQEEAMQDVNKSSGAYLAGSLLDPTAMAVGTATGTNAARYAGAIPKVAPYVANILGGMAAGATVGAIDEDGSALIGAGIGGAASAVLPPAVKGFQKALAYFKGDEAKAIAWLRQLYPQASDAQLDAIKIRATHPLVHGEQVMVGHAAGGPRPSPLLAALQKGAESSPEQARNAARITQANEDARDRVLEWIAQPGRVREVGQNEAIPPSMLKAGRALITAPEYRKFAQEVHVIDDELSTILSGPMLSGVKSDALKKVNQSIVNTRGAHPAAYTPGTKSTYGYTNDSSLSEAYRPKQGKPAQVSMENLINIRKDLSKRINDLSTDQSAASKEERRLLLGAKGQLDRWMVTNSPKWDETQKLFAMLSEPQNQADVAIALKKALKTSTGAERPGAFLAAMEDAKRLIKTSTGDERFSQISQVMSPTQMRHIRGVQASLMRQADSESVLRNSSVLAETKSLPTQLRDMTPEMLKAQITIMKSLLGDAGKAVAGKTKKYIDNLVINDPEGLAKLLDKITPQQRRQVMDYLNSTSMLFGGIGAVTNTQ